MFLLSRRLEHRQVGAASFGGLSEPPHEKPQFLAGLRRVADHPDDLRQRQFAQSMSQARKTFRQGVAGETRRTHDFVVGAIGKFRPKPGP